MPDIDGGWCQTAAKTWLPAPSDGGNRWIHHYYGGIDFLEDVDIFCTNAVHENWDLPD